MSRLRLAPETALTPSQTPALCPSGVRPHVALWASFCFSPSILRPKPARPFPGTERSGSPLRSSPWISACTAGNQPCLGATRLAQDGGQTGQGWAEW